MAVISRNVQCRAVIFDMDGVIVNSEPRHKQAYLEVCEQIGYGSSHGFIFEDYVGRPDIDLWTDFLNRHRPKQTLDELLRLKRNLIIDWIRTGNPLFDGITDLLKSLSQKYILGLASGSERPVVNEVLKVQNLGRYFRATVSANETTRGKPDPETFLKAAALLNVPPGDCCVIEDSMPGVAAGLAAGMRVIAITNTHPADDLSRATHVVNTYGEIERLLGCP